MRITSYERLLVLFVILGMSFSGVGTVSQQESSIEPIRVGVFLDLTGHTAHFGQATLNGVKMAAAEINKAGGVNGRPFELIIEDDSGRAEEAARAVERLISQKKVHALLGEVASSSSLAAAPIAQRAKIPMIAPYSTNPAVTQARNYIFRVAFDGPFQGEVLAEFAVKTLRAKRVALLVDKSNDYSSILATAFEKRLINLGGHVVVRQSYTQGDKDFHAQLVAIKSYRPHLIFVPGHYVEGGIIAKQAKALDLKRPLLGGDSWDSRQLWDLGGASLNGSYIANHYASDNPSPANQEFVANYKAKYGGLEPDALAALGYDGLKLLADAIARAGTTDGPALREALAGTKDFEGVTGRITIDKNRNALKAAVILKLLDGKFVYFKTVQPMGEQSQRNVNINSGPKPPVEQNENTQNSLSLSANKEETDYFAHFKPEHRQVLQTWVKTRRYLRPGVEEIDNSMFQIKDKKDREGNLEFLRSTVGENGYQYYSVGDMNHDGKVDFAVLLVDTRKQKDEYDRFALAIFNAPFKSEDAPAYFEEGLTDISNCYIVFDRMSKRYLFLGKFESDALCATYYPKRKTYYFKDCMD